MTAFAPAVRSTGGLLASPAGLEAGRGRPKPTAAGRRLGPLLDEAFEGRPGLVAGPGSPGAGEVTVTGVASDSRRLAPGHLFVAVPGARFDGHDFLAEALDAGAAAALVERPGGPPGLPWVQAPDTRRAAGPVAAAFHARPSRRMRLVGVTGTNGKTTVAWLLDHLFSRAFGGSLFAGTVGHRLRIADREVDPPGAGLTTREAPEFQSLLARARAAGVRAGAVECSSHGLAQARLDGTAFEVAVFTNLTRDHLDFHAGFEDYFAAKRSLFTRLLRPDGTAVITADGSFGPRLAKELETARPDVHRVLFGSGAGASVRIASVSSDLDGLRVTLDTAAGTQQIESPLTGDFHAANLAAAWAAATALGVPADEASARLGEVGPPPGRMERIAGEGGAAGAPAVFVDYAHTPDALARALAAARCLVGAGRLTVVFGAGGDRDQDKRPLMGDAAARLADRVVLTSDNPRSEDPAAILAAIRLGADNPGLSAEVEEEPDRAAAIEGAVARAAPGDLVLIAGKGHETTQQVGDVRLPCDDRALAKAALERWSPR